MTSTLRTTPTTTIRPALQHRQSIPTHLFEITRNQFMIIKSLHHRRNLSNGVPKTWKNAMQSFADSIKFAFTTEVTTGTINSYCSTLSESIKNTGIEHYNNCISTAMDFLEAHLSTLTAEQYTVSTNLVLSWYRKQFQKKSNTSVEGDCLDIFNFLFHGTCSDEKKASMPTEKLIIKVAGNERMFPKANTTDKSTQLDEIPKASISKKKRTSAPAVLKQHNQSRFFEHSQTFSDDELLQAEEEMATRRSPSKQLTLSQLQTVEGSIKKVAEKMEGQHNNIILGDENFEGLNIEETTLFKYTGRTSTLRAILEKVKSVSCKNLFISFSNLNLNCNIENTTKSNLNNIDKYLRNTFKNTNIFILLLGIDKNEPEDVKAKLQALNHALREKLRSYTIINPPDNFTLLHNKFSENTKFDYENTIKNFLN